MNFQQLPDGRFASSPIYAGTGPLRDPCPEGQHEWLTTASDVPGEEGCTMAQERCSRCEYIRVIVTPAEGEANLLSGKTETP